jgi:hypothetical protein
MTETMNDSLTTEQLDTVTGGNPILVGIAIGLAANAAYDLIKWGVGKYYDYEDRVNHYPYTRAD